jgi:hypothetical protein
MAYYSSVSESPVDPIFKDVLSAVGSLEILLLLVLLSLLTSLMLIAFLVGSVPPAVGA